MCFGSPVENISICCDKDCLTAPSPTPDRLGSREMFPGVVGSVFVWRMGCLCVCVWWGGGVVCIV